MGLAEKPAIKKVSSFFSSLESAAEKPAKKKNSNYRPGDIVVHEVFGEGVIISIQADKNLASIAFPHPFMTKTISLDFPKMHKKEQEG